MARPTPTLDTSLPRRIADFGSLPEALDYAAQGVRGITFYSARGDLGRALTYRELRDEALEYAGHLAGLNLPRQSRIALVAETSPEFVIAFFACQYAGLLPVPLPLPTSFGGREGYVEQLQKQMTSCGAQVLLGPVSMEDIMQQSIQGCEFTYAGAFDALRDLPKGAAQPDPLRADEVCYLQYSSGSTRFPHGVTVMQNAAMANCLGNARDGVQVDDDDRVVSWLPLYHDMGLVGCLLTPVTSQISVDLLPTEYFARRPLLWLKLMSENRGTVSFSPSFGYDLCSRRATPDRIAEFDLTCWRVAGIGADMIRADVLREFHKTFAPAGFPAGAFLPSYGLAECTLSVSFVQKGQGVSVDVVDERTLSADNLAVPASECAKNTKGNFREVVNCGAPLDQYDVEIRKPVGGLCGDREVGKIFVRGPSVMVGYFNDPKATKQVLSTDGWLDTGDMGYFLEGSLYIVGRAKDLIIINGVNHWPQDIEWAVEQLDGLRSGDSAAISVPGLADEEVATVLVHCRMSGQDERQALIEAVKKKVQSTTGITPQVALVKPRSLPRTSSGKLSRAKARAKYLAGALEPLEGSDPAPWIALEGQSQPLVQAAK